MTTQAFIGKFVVRIEPDGTLVLATPGEYITATLEETRGIFDFLLQHARHFQASNGSVVDSEPLRMQARMERE